MKIKKDLVETVAYVILGVLTAYLLNFGLGLALGTPLPVVAVVSDSMTHDATTPIRHYQFLENLGYSKEEIDSWPITGGFLRGDALVVVGVKPEDLKVGDVIVFQIEGQSTPVVHRIVKIENGQIITKGDHNPTYDPWRPKKIYGKVVTVIPLLGWPKLVLTQLVGGLIR